jgi:hypothetical protein
MRQELSARISRPTAAHIQLKLTAGGKPPRPAPSSGKPSDVSRGRNWSRSARAAANVACTAWLIEVGSTSYSLVPGRGEATAAW